MSFRQRWKRWMFFELFEKGHYGLYFSYILLFNLVFIPLNTSLLLLEFLVCYPMFKLLGNTFKWHNSYLAYLEFLNYSNPWAPLKRLLGYWYCTTLSRPYDWYQW